LTSCTGEDCITCYNDREEFIANCPCNDYCPNDCPCPGFDCDLLPPHPCEDPESNPVAVMCADLAQSELDTCAENCFVDEKCLRQCYVRMEMAIKNCPCGEHCLDGCPCPDFNCNLHTTTTTVMFPTTTRTTTTATTSTTTTTTTTTWSGKNDTIFVINTFYDPPQNPPVLIHVTGNVNKPIELNGDAFTYDKGTEAYRSCSFTQNGIMYIAGGVYPYRRQISIIEQCRLRNIGELSDDFEMGACNNFMSANNEEYALLCFGYGSSGGCARFDGQSIVSAQTAYKPHYGTSLGNWQNIPVAAGGSYDSVENLENDRRMKNNLKEDFKQYSFDTVYHDLYMFGGMYGRIDTSTAILKYDGWTFTEVGQLLDHRYGHRSVVKDNIVYLVGGYREWPNGGYR